MSAKNTFSRQRAMPAIVLGRSCHIFKFPQPLLELIADMADDDLFARRLFIYIAAIWMQVWIATISILTRSLCRSNVSCQLQSIGHDNYYVIFTALLENLCGYFYESLCKYENENVQSHHKS